MQGLFTLGPDTAIHIVTLGVVSIMAVFGYKQQIASAKGREERVEGEAKLLKGQADAAAALLASQNAMRMDMDAKHAENRQGLAVHVREDDIRFDGISRTLQRIDTKLDKISDRQA